MPNKAFNCRQQAGSELQTAAQFSVPLTRRWAGHMFLFDRKLDFFALFLTCLAAIPNPGHATPSPSPASVKAKALKAQDACFKKLSQDIKANEGSCGNSGCGAVFSGCYVRGESVVIDAINDVVKRSSGRISEVCLDGIATLANEATNDNPWLDRIAQQLPVGLDGDPFILYRLYFYELIYRTVNNAECKR